MSWRWNNKPILKAIQTPKFYEDKLTFITYLTQCPSISDIMCCKCTNRQEAFGEGRHLHVCYLFTLSCDLDRKSRSKRLMSLEVVYCIVP